MPSPSYRRMSGERRRQSCALPSRVEHGGAVRDGEFVSSDGAVLLLEATERRSRICERLASCFHDYRDPVRVEHSVLDLVRQRWMGLALGYEDLNEHDVLRRDPLIAACARKHGPKANGECARETRVLLLIRGRWPNLKNLLRGDSYFCRDELMDWCDKPKGAISSLLFARNPRLQKAIAAPYGKKQRGCARRALLQSVSFENSSTRP